MTRNEIRDQVAAQARLLGPRLYEGMSVALQAADTRSRGLPHSTYPHLRPLITRIEAREYLRREGLPMPWAVDGNPGPHGSAVPHREGPRTHPADAEGTATHLSSGSPRRRAKSCSATRLAGAAAASDVPRLRLRR